MFFELDGKTYKIKFSRAGTSTFSELWSVDDDGIWNTGLLGWTKLHPKDRFVKKTGRKIALANLLDRMEEVSAGDTEPEFVLTKETKRNIWETYFKAHKK